MIQPLQILAGPEARRRIAAHGFSLGLFDTFIGASGGPKWLALSGLDRVLAPALAARRAPIQMIGSSIGAVRIACYAQRDPVAAFDRFLSAYLDVPKHRIDKPSLQAFVKGTVDAVLDGGAADQVLANRLMPLHIVTARCRGFAAGERAPQLGMVPAALQNLIDPARMSRAGVSRSLFVSDAASPISIHAAYAGDRIPLTNDNFSHALHATGSIPGFLDGITDIPGAPPGVYRDGGIVDYHFKPDWHTTDGLILYPHFSPVLVPGWFDKLLRARHLDPASIDRLVVLTPSPAFIASLPYGKIPERRDAVRLDPPSLRRYWSTVARETGRLGEALHAILESGVIPASNGGGRG